MMKQPLIPRTLVQWQRVTGLDNWNLNRLKKESKMSLICLHTINREYNRWHECRTMLNRHSLPSAQQITSQVATLVVWFVIFIRTIALFEVRTSIYSYHIVFFFLFLFTFVFAVWVCLPIQRVMYLSHSIVLHWHMLFGHRYRITFAADALWL